jgi:hypothetical protein
MAVASSADTTGVGDDEDDEEEEEEEDEEDEDEEDVSILLLFAPEVCCFSCPGIGNRPAPDI